MVNDLKLGIRSLRYAYGRKVNGFISLLCLLAGLVLLFCGEDGMLHFLGTYAWMMVGLCHMQMLYSLSATNMMLASPRRRRMQTSVPAALSCSYMVLVYLVYLLILAGKGIGRPETLEACSGQLVQYGLIAACLMLYMAWCYKYFVPATVVFCLAFAVVSQMFSTEAFKVSFPTESLWVSFGLNALLGLAILLAGGFLEYLVSLLVYKAPMSRHAQSASLRKEM